MGRHHEVISKVSKEGASGQTGEPVETEGSFFRDLG
jgi:hypothetical protein